MVVLVFGNEFVRVEGLAGLGVTQSGISVVSAVKGLQGCGYVYNGYQCVVSNGLQGYERVQYVVGVQMCNRSKQSGILRWF